jgi:hypothetical protein
MMMIDMFLYAHLAIEYLLQQPTKGMLLEKAKGEMLPKKLQQMYVDTMFKSVIEI